MTEHEQLGPRQNFKQLELLYKFASLLQTLVLHCSPIGFRSVVGLHQDIQHLQHIG